MSTKYRFHKPDAAYFISFATVNWVDVFTREMFEEAGWTRSNVEKYQLWQHDNKPIEVYSNKVIKKKFDYIHMNPVEEGLVVRSIDWKYSSPRNYFGDNSVIEIDLLGSLIQE